MHSMLGVVECVPQSKGKVMSHVYCLRCRKNDHVCQYGIGFGGEALYTICDCGEILEHIGIDDDEGLVPMAKRIPQGLEMTGGSSP